MAGSVEVRRRRLVLTSIDGDLIVAEPVGRLYGVSVDGVPLRRLVDRSGLRALVVGPLIPRAAEEDFRGPVPSMVNIPARFAVLSGSCGTVVPAPNDRVVKVVALPDEPMSVIRRRENSQRLDPWRAYVGSSILAINRAQADLFRDLEAGGSPSSLPEVHEYREGLLDRTSLDSLRRINPDMASQLRIGDRVASWVMERVGDEVPGPTQRDLARRQALDYLFRQHGMIARDLASDDNWGTRSDGSAVLLDPVVVPIGWMGPIPSTMSGIRSMIRRAALNDTDLYVSTVAPFGSRLTDGTDAISIALLATSLAYRTPDPAFDAILEEYLNGVRLPHGRRTYLGYPHGIRPFHV